MVWMETVLPEASVRGDDTCFELLEPGLEVLRLEGRAGDCFQWISSKGPDR